MRCVNIDWLEVYCLESVDYFPCNADFYRTQNFEVVERDYGTRQYAEMFTILDKDGHAFVEIRRNPVAAQSGHDDRGIFSEFSTHIRLVNRYCYAENAVTLLSDFLHRFDYTIVRIYRLDICLDFERFDSGDDPFKFMQRYMAGRYSKINQSNLSGHAKDRWESREWNSASWGSPQSMVTTKLYDKTLELKEVKDKPYIRLAWFQSGLVDHPCQLYKVLPDGTTYKPRIWRVEFSIRSSARGWVVVEDSKGTKKRRVVMEHTLGSYATRQQLLHAFANLADHYFHFKKFIEGVRKDRCPDKILFKFNLDHTPYKLDILATDTQKPRSFDQLARKLREYKLLHTQKPVVEACDLLLSQLEDDSLRHDLVYNAKDDASKLLQLLLDRRIRQNPKEPLSQSIETVQALLDLGDTLF